MKRSGNLREAGRRIIRDIRQYIWVAAVFLIYYQILHSLYNAFCPFLIVTGIPCAGCGLTRAGLYLLRGQFVRAAFMNPSIYPTAAFLVYCGYFRYIRGEAVKGVRAAIPLLVVSMLVIYGVRMYLYFPDRAPYVYQSRNFLAEQVPGYRGWMQKLLEQIRLLRQ